MLAARAAHLLGDEAEARALWLRVADSGDRRLSAEAGIAWARSAESSGDLEGALHRLAGLTGDAHHGAEAAYLAGRIELQHGRTEEAITRFSLAAGKRRQRFSDEACWWLGWAHYGGGHFDRAVSQWQALEKGWPRSPLIPQGLYWRARALDQTGKGREARAIRDRLPAVAPGSYYAVLADRASPRPVEIKPERCELSGTDPGAPFWVAYRRAALLHGLGLPGLGSAELDVASRKAHGAAEAWAVAQLDSAVGETGRAFARANGSAAACISSSWPSPPLYPQVAPVEVAWAARAVGIARFWIDALMRRESRFEASARSPAGAVGLLQMLPVTAARIASIAGVAPPDLAAPSDSIWFGAWYLAALSERFSGNFLLVAAAYDAGPASVASWLSSERRCDEFVEQIPFRETRAYVKEAVANLAAYQALYGPADLKMSADAKLSSALATSGVSF
jgi:soluble lytic murein transglycosylase